jgi:hypothetical protein
MPPRKQPPKPRAIGHKAREVGREAYSQGKTAIRRMKRQNHSPLRLVKWSDYYRPGWKPFIQRLLPITTIALLILPFTTGITDGWYLAKLLHSRNDGGDEVLSAWGGSSLLD